LGGGGERKEDEKGAIGDSIWGEGGGEDFLRYFRGNVLVLMEVPGEGHGSLSWEPRPINKTLSIHTT
jgi:hypothetical protein